MHAYIYNETSIIIMYIHTNTSTYACKYDENRHKKAWGRNGDTSLPSIRTQVALADLEPKEKSKRKQIEDREAKVIVANRLLRKANERTLALEARLEAATTAMEEHRIKVSIRI
jgi:hypothetical protein